MLIMSSRRIAERKKDHLRQIVSDVVQVGDAGFGKYRFNHNALPEIDFEKIDTSTKILGKKVDYPFFISCMSGGINKGLSFNNTLAKAAQKYGIAMGVGSQRIAIEYPVYEKQFQVRKYAPDIPLIANIGLVQLNYGYGLKEFQKCIDMIDADALAVHINPIQEVVQPEGDRNFEKLLPKLEKLVKKLTVPIIVKEVGFGLSESVAVRLNKIGIAIFDTAGWGGTNWALVEGYRGKADKSLGELFSQWGIPTAESIVQVRRFKDNIRNKKLKNEIVILGSGGVRSGVDIAKALSLGADLVGIATPFAKAALKSQKEVEKLIERYALELKVCMFGVGAKNIDKLKRVKLSIY
jgi:isopentenyl-diphosphate delta-isomerase